MKSGCSKMGILSMVTKKKVAVFAASECKEDRQDYYYNLAFQTGTLLAKKGFVVVTGGGPGLMDQVMRGAYEAGGETIGICLQVEGRANSKYFTRQEMYDKLNPRQQRLIDVSDAYIALPGGIGTLYEIVAVLAQKRKKDIPAAKPFIIVDGYYRQFQEFLQKMIEEGFIPANINSYYEIAPTAGIAVEKLHNYFK